MRQLHVRALCWYLLLSYLIMLKPASVISCWIVSHYVTRKITQFIPFYRWTELPRFTSGKWGCSAICLSDNQALLVGGSGNSKEADLLTRGTAGAWQWRSIAPMLAGHSYPGIAKLNGCILVAGGKCSDVELLTISADDPHDLGQWTLLTPLSRAHDDPFIASFSGRILIFSKFHFSVEPLM